MVSNVELTNYVAWYALPAKRFTSTPAGNHHKSELANYTKLRRGLGITVVKDEPLGILDDVNAVMKDANADYLAVSGNANDNLAMRMRANQRDWPYVHCLAGVPTGSPRGRRGIWTGRTTIFGWARRRPR